MPDLGRYAGTVLSAYAVGLGLILLLVALTWWRGRRVRRTLGEVEARRVARAEPVSPDARHG